LRDELYRRLKELGHTPWLSEMSDFPINLHPDSMTNCIRVAEECDLFVVLLDKRAGLSYAKKGSPYPDLSGLKISEAEYRCARKKGKPVCIFIRKRAEYESAIYRQIKDDEKQKKSIKWYSETAVYEFYDRLMHEEPHIPWRYTFDSINEIMEPLNVIIGEVQYPHHNGKYVKFTCISREAEHAKEVYVASEFNNWLGPNGSLIRPSLKDQERYGLQKQIREGKEIWEKDILVSPGHYDFKFVVGRRHWIHWDEESGYTRGNDAPGGPNFRIEVPGTELHVSGKDVISENIKIESIEQTYLEELRKSDIRVSVVAISIVLGIPGVLLSTTTKNFIEIKAQNYAKAPVFLKPPRFRIRNETGYIPISQNDMTSVSILGVIKKLEPGNSWEVSINPARYGAENIDKIDYVAFIDKLDREYKSSSEEMSEAIEKWKTLERDLHS